jgi:hypothetical protein
MRHPREKVRMSDNVQRSGPAESVDTRLEFRDTASTSVALDGAWWPHTRDSAGELAALVRALDARQAQVRLLMLNPHGWRGHPRRIDLVGRSVRIEWMTMLDRSVVIGATARGGRIDLHLVIPADGGEPGAAAAAPVAAPQAPPRPASPRIPPAALLEHAALGATLARMIEALDGFGTDAPAAWVEHVRLILDDLRADLRRYHDVVQAPAGTYYRVVATAPRLSNAIANLEREHLRIGASLDRMLQWASGPPAATLHVLMRAEGLSLVRDLIRYRQHGADLLHQADGIDLGGQG